MNFIQTTVAGRLGQAPKMHQFDDGSKVAELRIATNIYRKDKDPLVEWTTAKVYGKSAENVEKFLGKGDVVLVSGTNRTRSWEKDGQKHYATEVLVDTIQFGPKKSSENSDDSVVDVPAGVVNSEVSMPGLDDIPF